MSNRVVCKKILGISLVLCMGSCISHDADVDQADMPAMIKNSFDAIFPDAKIIGWENVVPWYKINFKEDTFEKNAWFSVGGQWLMTQTTYGPYLTFLPISVQEAFQESNYSDWQVEAVDGFERMSDTFYMIEAEAPGLDEIQLIFAEDGTILHIADSDTYQITPNIIFHVL